MYCRSALALATIVLMLLPGQAASQDVAHSFDQLQTLGLVKQGDTVYVTEADGRRTKGKLADVSATFLVLVTGTFKKRSRDFPAGSVERIERGDSLLNGTLIGLGAGSGFGALSPRLWCDLPDAECEAIVFLVIGLPAIAGGAILGAVVDAFIRKAVYLGPGATGSVRLWVSPVLSDHRKGVSISLQF